jgi:hypothetical protein
MSGSNLFGLCPSVGVIQDTLSGFAEWPLILNFGRVPRAPGSWLSASP